LYSSGAPELIIEVAVSSQSREFGAKKSLYDRSGVREYLIAVPLREEIYCFERIPSGFQPVTFGADGIALPMLARSVARHESFVGC